ncbi:MAG: crossover junction endodeoxyribonuclease RuvC [bacterium]
MRVIGVDPGTLTTGFGIIEGSLKGEAILIYAGTISTKPKEKISTRLKHIYDQLVDILSKYKPESVAVEDTFYSCNIKSALKLGQARGVALLAAENLNLPISEYSPLEVKKSVVGYGRAEKEQVRIMIKKLLDINTLPSSYDLSDALAVAMCHLNSSRYKDKIGRVS